MQGSQSIDPPDELLALLQRVHGRCSAHGDGTVATYIPELAKAQPDRFGLAATTVGGEQVVVGDADVTFTLQSVCKPFLYACALARHGRGGVHRYVGVEPSGDAFNALVEVEARTHRPHNPMINAGAIVVSSLLVQQDPDAAMASVLSAFGRWAGRSDLEVDEAVYRSEVATGDRNRAIAHLMHHLGMLDGAVEAALDLYFRACSVRVTTRDLTVMAATLAAAGRNPRTGARAASSEIVRDVLTVMSTCGMYDGTGRFAVTVGMPAKSGVSGGVLAVAPGRLGLAAYSPRLDPKGNSVRGMAALDQVAAERVLHLFQPTAPAVHAAAPIPLGDLRRACDAAQATAVTGGAVARYIPELADADPGRFGLAICTVSGDEVATGEVDAPFTIQAAANPFGYACALADRGSERVHARVGLEPSGNPYDAVEFAPATERPYNPFSNAGAIAVADLQVGRTVEERWARLQRFLAEVGGSSTLPLDQAVLASEHRAGARNRAIGYLLRSFGVIDDVESAVELYLRQCSLLVTARQLAVMGGVLATGGRHPLTGKRLLSGDVVQRVLTLMYTCGMHDASGQFAFDVGLPGKSGVSGAIVAVVPGRMGVAVFSPPVDTRGASVRGVAALRLLSGQLQLGVLALGEPGG